MFVNMVIAERNPQTLRPKHATSVFKKERAFELLFGNQQTSVFAV
jgi:hypothetical protein